MQLALWSHVITLPSSALDEDPDPLQEDEIQARVTLIPLQRASPSRASNLVRRGGPVILEIPEKLAGADQVTESV